MKLFEDICRHCGEPIQFCLTKEWEAGYGKWYHMDWLRYCDSIVPPNDFVARPLPAGVVAVKEERIDGHE